MLTRILIVIAVIANLFVSQHVQAETSEFIKRMAITSAIEDREPVDSLTHVDENIDKVYFFNEVVNKADSHITHRWFLNGKLEVEVVLKIGSNRWRTYSSKNLVPALHSGNWQVEVIDQENNLLASAAFSY